MFVTFQAAPQMKMDLLEQVAPLVEIGFVGAGEPRQRRTEFGRG